MNKLTKEKIERIGYLYSNLTYRFDDCTALTHSDASDIIWEFVRLLDLDCNRDKLDEIIHYWRQVEDIEEDCQLGIVCDYLFNGGLVPEDHELEIYRGGLSD